MVLQMVSKVPQVQGKCEEVMSALMEWVPDSLEYGDEKFCTILYLPGLYSLGMMDMGRSGKDQCSPLPAVVKRDLHTWWC